MMQDFLDDYRELEDANKVFKKEVKHLNKVLEIKDKQITSLLDELDYLYSVLEEKERYIIKYKNTIKAYEDYLYNQ